MPDLTSTPASPKVTRSFNRWGIGSISILQLVLLTIALIAANYLSHSHYFRTDLSRSSDYSLSTATRQYLASPACTQHPGVRFILAFRRSSPFYERVRALAEEYQRLSQGKIALEVVDPLRSPDRMQEIIAAYGISLVRDLVLIDARTDDQPAVRETAEKIRALHPRVKLLAAEDMAVFTTADGKRRITGFCGEELMTAKLVEAIEGAPRRMALIADKSRIESNADTSQRAILNDLLRYQSIELTDLQIASCPDIPADLSGIVLAAPKYDFTDAEIAVLERYWNRPRAAILVLVEPGAFPPKLRAFLRAHGVTPHNNRVISTSGKSLVTAARGTFSVGVPFLRDLSGQSTELGGASCSLEVREAADDLINRRVFPVGLLTADPSFWGEAHFGKGNETFDPIDDTPPPFQLAAAVTRGAESDDRVAHESSRMVVIANCDFLKPIHHRAENLDFLASSVNWLVGRDALTGTGPRSLTTYKLPLLDAQVSFINRINLFFLPALFLLIGACVWSSRRA